VSRESIDAILKDVLKKDSLMLGPLNSVLTDIEAISTGSMAIDRIIGVGGLPRGRSVELFGHPSSGKTTCALQTAARAQQDPVLGKLAIVYLDWEQSLDKKYAAQLGLDVNNERFLFGQPDSLESGVNAARRLIATGEVSLVIFDSVAAMTPGAILEAETGKSTFALQARLMSDSMRVLNPLLREHKTTAIFLNHVMDVIETGPVRPGFKRTSTPGGRALKYYASVRLEFQQFKGHKVISVDRMSQEPQELQESQTVRVRVVKNKVAEPFRQAEVRLRFGKGFSDAWTAFNVLIAHKVIVKGASGYYFFDEKRAPDLILESMEQQKDGNQRRYIRGEQQVFAMIDAYPAWEKLLIARALEKVSESEVGLVEIAEAVVDEEQDISPEAEESLLEAAL
jgi:recombination protein RecA